jgi:hypothetical protein
MLAFRHLLHIASAIGRGSECTGPVSRLSLYGAQGIQEQFSNRFLGADQDGLANGVEHGGENADIGQKLERKISLTLHQKHRDDRSVYLDSARNPPRTLQTPPLWLLLDHRFI